MSRSARVLFCLASVVAIAGCGVTDVTGLRVAVDNGLAADTALRRGAQSQLAIAVQIANGTGVDIHPSGMVFVDHVSGPNQAVSDFTAVKVFDGSREVGRLEPGATPSQLSLVITDPGLTVRGGQTLTLAVRVDVSSSATVGAPHQLELIKGALVASAVPPVFTRYLSDNSLVGRQLVIR